jgi:hypothetical protein
MLLKKIFTFQMIEICYFIAGNGNGQSLGYIFVSPNSELRETIVYFDFE